MPHALTTRIDYDAHRDLARSLRQRARSEFYWRLFGGLRSLLGFAIIFVTFWLMPEP